MALRVVRHRTVGRRREGVRVRRGDERATSRSMPIVSIVLGFGVNGKDDSASKSGAEDIPDSSPDRSKSRGLGQRQNRIDSHKSRPHSTICHDAFASASGCP
ncbi:hypothetical protein CIHG_08264 [Coccidioides immitis H538.4]|uniref:Uncharacterized protein n=1 Tax=Coccidioides immitis H538.4 TaxID=396776 RepID=A0A0J8S2H2_COCIT|nr:hypothetical protein CIHG_08264 [Coccidioides immitis H538.4]